MKQYRDVLSSVVITISLLCCCHAAANSIVNPSFEEGTAGWTHYDSAYFSGLVANSVFTDGTHHYRFWSLYNLSCPVGAFESLSQSVDLTDVYEIAFDVELTTSRHKAVFLVDGAAYWSQTTSGTFLDQVVDVSGLSGFHTIELRQECVIAETDTQSTTTRWDNLRTLDEYAADPSPADGATDIAPDITLHWLAGYYAAAVNGHDVYFGTNYNDVLNGVNGTSQGLQSSTAFTPGGPLIPSATYYWRVDETDGAQTWTGDVWSFTVDEPTIELSTTILSFLAKEGLGNPDDQILSITNTSLGTLNWQITETCDWLTAAPDNGSSSGEADSAVISVNTTGLTAGRYGCELTVTAPEAENSPQSVVVWLSVLEPGSGLFSRHQSVFAISAVSPDAGQYIRVLGQDALIKIQFYHSGNSTYEEEINVEFTDEGGSGGIYTLDEVVAAINAETQALTASYDMADVVLNPNGTYALRISSRDAADNVIIQYGNATVTEDAILEGVFGNVACAIDDSFTNVASNLYATATITAYAINLSDFSALASIWGADPSSENWNPAYDFDSSGNIDIGDVLILSENWATLIWDD